MQTGKKITHEEYVQRVAKINPEIEVLGVYVNSTTKILHRCKIDGFEWYATPSSIISQKTGCPKCSLVRRISKKTKTHEQYVEELLKVNPNIEIVEKYKGALTKTKHRCTIDNYQWSVTPASVLFGSGCPKCAKRATIDHDTYLLLLKEHNKNIEVLGHYIDKMTPIRHRCVVDGHEWDASPSCLLNGFGCPVCGKRIIGDPPEYKNSIWASEHREYFSKYMTEEQMKSYMPNSCKKINIPCCDCGHVKNIRIADLLRYGFSCQKCGDGVSYPNKFGRAFISQLNVNNVIYEYAPKWLIVNGNQCFYDIYFEHNKNLYVIEMDGGLGHGNRAFNCENSDTEGLLRDVEKDRLAFLHNINVVRIDAKKSDKEYIKNSIMNSCLPHILHFQTDDIDWEECDKFATLKFVFTASDLWKSGLSIREISNILQVHHDTTTRYLKRATELGVCNYSKEESQRRAGKQRSGTKNVNARKVINLKNNVVYNTLSDAAKINNLHITTIIKRCKKHKDFMYYDEWLLMSENCKEGDIDEKF